MTSGLVQSYLKLLLGVNLIIINDPIKS